MVQVAPFRIEQFYARYEFTTRYMLSSSDCESRTIGELLALEPGACERLLDLRCGYTEPTGAAELREAIATTYASTGPGQVLVTSCAEEAIFLVYHALVGPGDHVIVETPCYQSALELARSTGASVSEWHRRYEDGWAHDVDALARLFRPQTRLLYLNEPHNPTGTLMGRATFDRVVELAAEAGTVLFCDEVYRGLEQDPGARLDAGCDRYARAISLGSVSKSYGLPGLRTGWLATHDAAARGALGELKHYTTICTSAPSELLSAIALRSRRALLDRNMDIIQHNLPLLDAFMARHDGKFSWARPAAGPIGFPRVSGLGDVDALCQRLAEMGVLLLPGSVYDEPEHVRIGFGRSNMPAALEILDDYLSVGTARP
jgi:aspartate/methionine/tyrosine aminotransferase